MNFFTILLLTATITIGTIIAETAPNRAKSFADALGKACAGKSLTCVEPFLHQDFKFINATGEVNRADYVKFLESTKGAISAFEFKTDAATDAPENQVKLPVHAGGNLRVHVFLVADAKLDGGEAVIVIDKKNV